jgi:hypothetical protein
MYACDTWGVDIISLSFGYDACGPYLDPIRDAINYAKNEKGIIVIASARNDGYDKQIAWPARMAEYMEVICANSADAKRKPSEFNPKTSWNTNIYVQGEGIRSAWLSNTRRAHSGTLWCAPTMAAIGATMIEYLDYYIQRLCSHEGDKGESERIRDLKEEAKKLRSLVGMVDVLRKKCSEESNHEKIGTYYLLNPAKLFDWEHHRKNLLGPDILITLETVPSDTRHPPRRAN